MGFRLGIRAGQSKRQIPISVRQASTSPALYSRVLLSMKTTAIPVTASAGYVRGIIISLVCHCALREPFSMKTKTPKDLWKFCLPKS